MKTTIRVNRKRPESMTKQITDQLTNLIESGAMTVGSYLPSERELANSLKVARNVVRGSYENLMKAGRIQSEGRKGRTVRASGARKRAGTTKKARSIRPPIMASWPAPRSGSATSRSMRRMSPA